MTKNYNKYYYPSRDEINIIRSFAKGTEAAVTYFHFDLADFIDKTLKTRVFSNYFEDYTIFSQAPTYTVEEIIDELKECGKIEIQKEKNTIHSDVAYWV